MNTKAPTNSQDKLPPVDVYFWIMIITATTLGETAGDLLSMTLHIGYLWSSVILVALFATALAAQLISKTPHRGLYWAVIVLTSTAGTTLSDYLTRSLALGYTKASIILVALLVATFISWRSSAKKVSVESVTTMRAEVFYWSAILFSSTLGTAFGDFLADETGLHLGFGGGTALLAVLLIVIALAARSKLFSGAILFWMAIVVTHPIGATMGDYLTKPSALNFGPLQATLGLVVLFVIVATVIGRKTRNHHA